MATTAGDIITEALERFVVFDEGESAIGDDDNELFRIINKALLRRYAMAGSPIDDERHKRNDQLAVTSTVTLDGSVQATLPSYSWTPEVRNAAGSIVARTSRKLLDRGRAELPPAVYIRGSVITSCARTGDPVQNDVLTLHYTPIPGTITARAHFIGATTVTDASTSKWPTNVGDEWLIWTVVYGLALKTQDFPADELDKITAMIERNEAILMAYLRGIE